MSQMQWYVDALYCAHMNKKGHSGMMMTIVLGSSIRFAHEQKLNAHSSTERGTDRSG